MVNSQDLEHLRLAISLAKEALEAGDAPFGSVLVGSNGKVLQTNRNRTVSGEEGDGKADATLHPEFTLARWAQLNLDVEERAKTTVYTSGEHCAMCSAAHAYCGLGSIVYASSTEQYGAWLKEYGVGNGKIQPLTVNQVALNVHVEGPVAGLDAEVKALHVRRWTSQGFSSKAEDRAAWTGTGDEFLDLE